jgi:putative flippase GtrA
MLIATELQPEAPTAPTVALPIPPLVASSSAGEAIRYLLASVAALGLDAGLLWVGVNAFALPAWLAGAFSYGAGLVFIYLLSIRWVFAERAVRDRKSEFLAFAVLGVVGLCLNSLTLYVATGFGLALPFAKALSAGIGFVANFVSRKVLLFSTRNR